MRVITGVARGRNLITLAGEEITRPTSQSTKEALFSAIQFELEEAQVLDLFAGSGQLGIEALSRGARICTFVENNRAAYQIVEKNVETCGMADRAQLVYGEALSFLNRSGCYDVALLDPPYRQGMIAQCLTALVPHMRETGVIVCETARDEALPATVDGWHVSKEKYYGKTKLTYYRKGGNE